MNLEHNPGSLQNSKKSLNDDVKTLRRIELALKRSKELDQTLNMDRAAVEFNYVDVRNRMWNPEKFSLLYGTPIWDQATASQKVKLNQLFWVAYYSQIISAEIATIFFNQTACAALYSIEDFRPVCDTLDLESAQERAHINAFAKISKQVEAELFGERLFSYEMRSPFEKTMLYSDLSVMKQWMRIQQLRAYSVLSSNSAFIGCQYFTVRGIRTLNGKIVQHRLSQFYTSSEDRDATPIPSKISYYHFIDESFHFNTSTVISHDVVNSLKEPNKFESHVANMALWGCQKDHYNFSTAINGIMWYDPALFNSVFRVLKSPIFGLDTKGALALMEKTFCQENEGMLASAQTHRESVESYKSYLADFKYITKENREMALMSRNSIEKHLATNRRAFANFKSKVGNG
jgi:hypothetical protein